MLRCMLAFARIHLQCVIIIKMNCTESERTRSSEIHIQLLASASQITERTLLSAGPATSLIIVQPNIQKCLFSKATPVT
jgi:hypothetical protein